MRHPNIGGQRNGPGELLATEGFTTLFEHHPQGIFVFTPDRRFVFGNPAMLGASVVRVRTSIA